MNRYSGPLGHWFALSRNPPLKEQSMSSAPEKSFPEKALKARGGFARASGACQGRAENLTRRRRPVNEQSTNSASVAFHSSSREFIKWQASKRAHRGDAFR